MADPRGINPQASYANKFSIMISGMVRVVFIDERQASGRVPETESIVSEIVMTHDVATMLANEIVSALTTPVPTPVLDNGPFNPRRTV
jgi:hypothetical protein